MQVKLRARLVDQCSSEFYETLRDQKASKYLSNDKPKVSLRDHHELLLFDQRSTKISCTRLQASWLLALDFGGGTCATCLIKSDFNLVGFFVSLTPQLWRLLT